MLAPSCRRAYPCPMTGSKDWKLMRRMHALGLSALMLLGVAGGAWAQTGGWELTCRDDDVEKVRKCALFKGELFIVGGQWADESGYLLVSVGADPKPGSPMVLTVDKNAPVPLSATPTTEQSNNVIRQMIAGKHLRARYIAADGKPQEITVDLAGLREKVAELEKQLDSYAR